MAANLYFLSVAALHLKVLELVLSFHFRVVINHNNNICEIKHCVTKKNGVYEHYISYSFTKFLFFI